jgi:hypothetical protein
VLAVATVAEPGLRGAALTSSLTASPDALPERAVLLAPPEALALLAEALPIATLALQQPPDPPPPRS